MKPVVLATNPNKGRQDISQGPLAVGGGCGILHDSHWPNDSHRVCKFLHIFFCRVLVSFEGSIREKPWEQQKKPKRIKKQMDPKVFCDCLCWKTGSECFECWWNKTLGAKFLVDEIVTAPVLGASSQLVSSLQLWLVSPFNWGYSYSYSPSGWTKWLINGDS